jgi:hypothetical protein
MSLTKLSLAGKNLIVPGREKFNYSRPGKIWSVTSRLGTEKLITFFYSVAFYWAFSDRRSCLFL